MTNKGKIVLVTGAGGSIGSEICRQVAAQRPMCIVLFDNSELALYNIDRELSTIVPIIPVLGDILEFDDLEQVFDGQMIDTVYHTAAYKHVTMVQKNPRVAERVNVVGTRRLALAARRHSVGTFVLISTDKAVNPTCVMGKTKQRAEEIVRDVGFTVVRFGNVKGSSGSVIPLFKEQIARGGPVTVTHPSATRYFMSIEDAAKLVIDAGTLGKGTFVLDMGAPVKISDLAHDMILADGRDIGIKYIGLRPGEKMHEELYVGHQQPTTIEGVYEDVL